MVKPSVSFVHSSETGQVSKTDPSYVLARGVGRWFPSFIYSFLLLCPYSITIFNFDDHYIFEVALVIAIAFGVIVRDRLFLAARASFRINSKLFLVLLVVVSVFVIGLISGYGFADAYGDLRGNIALIIGFMVARYVVPRDYMLLIRLAIVTGILCSTYYISVILVHADYSKILSPYLALIVVVVLACVHNKMKYAFSAAVILVFLAAISFYRQYWLIVGLTLCFLFANAISKLRTRTRIPFLFAMILAIAVGVVLITIYRSGLDSFYFANRGHYGQLIGKTRSFFDAYSSGMAGLRQHDVGDALRFGYFQFIFEQPLRLFLPHGLGHLAVYGKFFPDFFDSFSIKANTVDSLAFYFAFHYGLLITVPLFIWVLRIFARASRTLGWMTSSYLFVVFLTILLFDGGWAVVILLAFWFGAFVGMIASLSNSARNAQLVRASRLYIP